MFSRLQYITDSPSLAEQACKAGVRWIQVRIKNEDENTWTERTSDMVKICKQYKAICVVNDNIEIAIKTGAGGIHLGKKDMSIQAARKILGNHKILIGGSANTMEDVIFYAEQKIDYMGLGPLRFTATKKDLNPVLGIEGYRNIMNEVIKSKLTIPLIYAIGGVEIRDVPNLLSMGISGVAVSSAISHAKNINDAVQQFYTVLGKKEVNYEISR